MKKLFLPLALLTAALASQGSAQTTIRINGYSAQDVAIMADLVNRFVKPALAKDKINVVYQPLAGDYNQQLTTLLAAGNAGDVFYLPGETLDGFVKTGKVLSLNGLVDTKPFLKNLNSAFVRNGKQYAISKDFNTLTLIYNKDLFDEAGVAYPTNNETWTTLQNKLTTIKKKLGSDYYGICLAPEYARMGQYAFSGGWKPFNAQGKTNLQDPAFVAAFNWFTGLAKDKVGVTPSQLSQGWSGGCLEPVRIGFETKGHRFA
ncbi:extracellular solute-binding protein [Deinococcus reticulitermitis]|uniref:Extracellular solute-binding protein n=1 Tax=Deinococcus reticulitermitis TaxID=856736 RepID=A0A1H7C3I7_9DEIO|nr:extracellular solute-binding protein [Deinococcus reticulitermitis]SEJ84251.1 extracellular solute-binding protein [Deinococcus reticulitermitis]